MSSKSSEASKSSQSSADKRITPGYKSVLVTDECFAELKRIQKACSNPRLDLRHVATGAIVVALTTTESSAAITRASVQVLIKDAQLSLTGVQNDDVTQKPV